jgi:[ribosomal protein S5]-alanine N-acetyltransferase
MPELERLRLDHGPALLAFERARAVRQVCDQAATEYGLSALTAVTTLDNTGSRIVLARAGFVVTGGLTVDDRPGLGFRRDLVAAIR